MPVSIEDVAKKANVSISTVSRVVNGKNIVNEKTRKRVEAAIDTLGYRPNVFARGLMLKKSNILALVLPDLHGEFYSKVIHGANSRARELGYHLMVSSVARDDDGSSVLSAVTGHGMVDGVAVMISEVDAKTRETLKQVEMPLVVLDAEVEGVKHDSVVIDQRRGAVAMIEHLLDQGAERVAFIGGPVTNYDTIERLQALRDVLQRAGLPLSAKDVHHLDYEYDTALELGRSCVKDWARRRVSVFAGNDEMAAGIIDAAIDSRLSLPEDLPVVGFDDTRIARMTWPRLTTVHVPMERMGAGAVELLAQRLQDPERPDTKLTLHSELVVRESC